MYRRLRAPLLAALSTTVVMALGSFVTPRADFSVVSTRMAPARRSASRESAARCKEERLHASGRR